MATNAGSRDKRVAERIRSDLSDMLLRGVLREPDVQGAIVSAVDVTPDLGVARIHLRLLETEVDAGRKKRLLSAMGRAAGFIRRELGHSLGVRRVPELRFDWDEAHDRATRMEQLLEEVRREDEERRR